MSRRVASRLRDFFEGRTEDQLRSVLRYDLDVMEIEYVRDDVAAESSEDELTEAIDESRFDSLQAPLYEHSFSNDHGDLLCMMTCFENVIEMNFVIEDGIGVAVAVDAAAMDDAHALISDARETILEDQE